MSKQSVVKVEKQVLSWEKDPQPMNGDKEIIMGVKCEYDIEQFLLNGPACVGNKAICVWEGIGGQMITKDYKGQGLDRALRRTRELKMRRQAINDKKIPDELGRQRLQECQSSCLCSFPLWHEITKEKDQRRQIFI